MKGFHNNMLPPDSLFTQDFLGNRHVLATMVLKTQLKLTTERNAGDKSGGCFVPVPPEKAGTDLFKPIVGRGASFADIDGDGDLDVVLTQTGGPPLLLRNDQGLKHHWLRLKLVGAKSNRSAIGAWIKVRVGGQTLVRQVMPTRSYLSQSELPVTIGLGQATRADEVEIKCRLERLRR